MIRYAVGAFCIGFVAFAAGLMVGSSPAPVHAQPQPRVQEWEYKVVKAPVTAKEVSEEINRLGKEGWEYADGFDTPDYLFKRPKR